MFYGLIPDFFTVRVKFLVQSTFVLERLCPYVCKCYANDFDEIWYRMSTLNIDQ
jgi:hypothetical protein